MGDIKWTIRGAPMPYDPDADPKKPRTWGIYPGTNVEYGSWSSNFLSQPLVNTHGTNQDTTANTPTRQGGMPYAMEIPWEYDAFGVDYDPENYLLWVCGGSTASYLVGAQVNCSSSATTSVSSIDGKATFPQVVIAGLDASSSGTFTVTFSGLNSTVNYTGFSIDGADGDTQIIDLPTMEIPLDEQSPGGSYSFTITCSSWSGPTPRKCTYMHSPNCVLYGRIVPKELREEWTQNDTPVPNSVSGNVGRTRPLYDHPWPRPWEIQGWSAMVSPWLRNEATTWDQTSTANNYANNSLGGASIPSNTAITSEEDWCLLSNVPTGSWDLFRDDLYNPALSYRGSVVSFTNLNTGFASSAAIGATVTTTGSNQTISQGSQGTGGTAGAIGWESIYVSGTTSATNGADQTIDSIVLQLQLNGTDYGSPIDLTGIITDYTSTGPVYFSGNISADILPTPLANNNVLGGRVIINATKLSDPSTGRSCNLAVKTYFGASQRRDVPMLHPAVGISSGGDPLYAPGGYVDAALSPHSALGLVTHGDVGESPVAVSYTIPTGKTASFCTSFVPAATGIYQAQLPIGGGSQISLGNTPFKLQPHLTMLLRAGERGYALYRTATTANASGNWALTSVTKTEQTISASGSEFTSNTHTSPTLYGQFFGKITANADGVMRIWVKIDITSLASENRPWFLISKTDPYVIDNILAQKWVDLLAPTLSALTETSTPPGSPSFGASYWIGSGATGAWAGHDNQIAVWQNPHGWRFYDPDGETILGRPSAAACKLWRSAAEGWIDVDSVDLIEFEIPVESGDFVYVRGTRKDEDGTAISEGPVSFSVGSWTIGWEIT